MSQDAKDELAGELGRVCGFQVEGRNDRENSRAGFGGKRHVAQVDAVEGCFADAEDERSAFFESDIGGAGDERVGEAEGDSSECAHGAWEDNHAVGRMAAAGDGRADIGVGVLDGFRRNGTEEFFKEIGAAADAEFFGKDAEGVFAGDEVDAGDAVVGFERAE